VAIWELRILIWASAFSAWLLAILPVLYYLWNGSGWQARKEKIVNSFNAKALALYYDLYFPGRAIKQTEVTKTFDIDYGKYYGRRHFVLPVVLLSLICGEAMWGLGRTVEEWLGVAQGPKYLPAMAVSAIAGAWMWVVSDQLTRLRNGDFARGDVSTAAFRFVIAIPFGYAIASLDPTFGLTLAFFIGAFPTQTLFTIGRRVMNQQLKMGDFGSSDTSELELLQNVGRSIAERFQDEGITTIAELAWNDPIEMSIRTNLDFNYVVDCMSQSLLALYVGSDIKKLAPYSLRGAQEATSMISDLMVGAQVPAPASPAGAPPAPQVNPYRTFEAADASLKGAAKMLGIDPLVLFHTLTCVKDDPYAQFLWEIWGN
jgi:hypothetical protein